jgi:hypothetical protein
MIDFKQAQLHYMLQESRVTGQISCFGLLQHHHVIHDGHLGYITCLSR